MRKYEADLLLRRRYHRIGRKPTVIAKVRAIPVNWNAFGYLLFSVMVSMFVVQILGCGLTAGTSDDQQSTLQSNAGTPYNTVSAMELGATQELNFASGEAEIEFSGGAETGRYVLALTGGISGSSLTIDTEALSSSVVASASQTGMQTGPSPALSGNPHEWFLQEEQNMRNDAPALSDYTGMSSYLSLGATDTFKVLTGSGTSFTTISAELVASSSNVNVYIDTTTTATITQPQRDALAATLGQLCGQLSSAFGAPSDINGNGKVDVVLSRTLSSFGGAPLSGYFWSGDLMPVGQQPSSNQREVVFLIAPDTNSFYGGTVPVDQVLTRVLPGVFAHELQHLLNFMHKISPEDPTINEALSHTVENWVGYPHELRYKQAECLNAVAQVNLGVSSIDIPTRGCAHLVIQHLCEQQGDTASCLGSMVQSSGTGWAALAQAADEDLGMSVARMLAGLVVTGTNLNSTSPLKFKALGTGPAGDATGFNPYHSYDDHRGTVMHGAAIDSSGMTLPYAKTLTGFGILVEVAGQSRIHIRLAGDSSGLYPFGAGGVIIRIPDTGASTITAAP